MFRLLYATLAVSLLGSSAAFGRELSNPVIPKLAGLAGKSLSAVDGSMLALAPAQGGLAREITVPDGRTKKTFFVLLNDRLGTVSEGRDGGGRTVAGVFRVTGTGIAAEYADGRSEILALNGAGGVSMVMHAPTGDVNCMAWYPAGHRFSVAERKAALADYARRLGMDAPRRSGVKHGCASAAEKIEDPQPSPAVYNPPSDTPAKRPDILGSLIARALTFYTRTQAVSLPQSDLVTRLNPASGAEDGFENFYANFLAAHEGGYTSNDGNGSPANFGINQGANPDIDVSNLTRSDAKQILHDRYWLASGADRLPAALAAVHGDTAINMGVGAANDLLAQSGGDPQKYLDLRDARYRAIGAPDSDKAKYLPLWLGRNEDLRNFAGDGGLADQEQSSAARSASADKAQERYCDAPNDYYAAVPSCTNNRQAPPPQWFR
ncbi:MAG TPA: glycosyl hydrolase 108 family protein [Rhizomicrobium sp.]|nr:glycosyl hydrolase 108 family protein [Rhizomicrobium sp.]